MSRLVHTGSVIVDIVLGVDAVPGPGGDTLARSGVLVAGGGLNTMIAARRDGMDVLFAGYSGTGPFGSIVRAALDASGVTVLHPPVPDEDSGYCVALVDARAERTLVTHLGAEGRIGLAEHLAIPLAPGDYVYVSGYSLATECNATALAHWLPAVPRDVTVLVDPSPLVGQLSEDRLAPLLDRADILTCNAREAAILARTSNLDEAMRRLCARLRPGSVAIIRDGGWGCRLAQAGPDGVPLDSVLVPTFQVKAIDTNGAGDAHAGVLLSGLSQGLAVRDAVRRANAAAAIAVTRPGPTSAPVADETDALLGV